MISSKMGTSFFDTVPEMNEFDFDLGTMDTFEDFDINMTCSDMMADTGADPFGDFSLEKSFDLIELNKVFQHQDSGYTSNRNCRVDSEALLEDFDCEETLKQDIMWSAHSINNASQIRSSGSRIKSTSTPIKMSLTPPSSYISQMFQHDSPLSSSSSSDDDTDTSCAPSPQAPPGHCQVTTDHCYPSLNTSPELLTPPESSEDEDSNNSCSSSPSSPLTASNTISKSRKTSRLSTIENDRLNKKSLLKSSVSVHHKNTLTSADKPKFIFSVRMKKGSSSLPPQLHRRSKVSRRDKKTSRLTTISSYKTLKENETGVLFSPANRQTIKVSCANEKILKSGDKLSNREARNVHNQMERQRRSDLNQAYATLKDFVPAIANSDRASKQMVLDKAIEHCQALRSREEAVREQRRQLSQRNEALRRKLELLQTQLGSQSTQELDHAHWEIQGW